MYGTSGNVLLVKLLLLLLVSIHFAFAWHQVTILEEERGGGGVGLHGPFPGSATAIKRVCTGTMLQCPCKKVLTDNSSNRKRSRAVKMFEEEWHQLQA